MQNGRALIRLRKERADLKREENQITAEITEIESAREQAPPDISEAQASLEVLRCHSMGASGSPCSHLYLFLLL